LGLGNPELTFNPVYPARFTDNDKTAYISSVGDIIDLDVVLVTASGNINVSPRFHPTVIETLIEMTARCAWCPACDLPSIARQSIPHSGCWGS